MEDRWGEWFNSYETRWRAFYERFNFRAAFAGIFVAIGLILLAKLITSRIPGAGLTGFVSQTSAAIFMGSSTGHFFGMALRKDGDSVTSFLVGGTATLAIALLSIVGLTYTGGLLLTFTLGVFLMHNSGLVANHEQIEKYVGVISEDGSTVVLAGLALWKYLIPLFDSLLTKIGGIPL